MFQRFKKWYRNERATNLLFKAAKLEQDGILDEAEAIYYHLIKEYPEFANGWKFLGRFLFTQGRSETAFDVLSAAAKTLESSAELLYELGNLLRADQRYDEALIILQQAVERDPNHVSSWSAIIGTQRVIGGSDGIETAFRNILRVKPAAYSWWENYGDFLWKQKRYSDAEDAFRRAIHYNPRFYVAWVKLGTALYSQQKFDEALIAYNTAIEIEPLTDYADEILGSVLEQAGLIESSLRERLEGTHPLARRLMTSKITLEGSILEIEQKFREMVSNFPNHPDSWRMLGICLLTQSRYEEAENVFRKAVELDPELFSAWSDLGIALIKQNRVEEGRTAIRRAISLNPFDIRVKILEALL